MLTPVLENLADEMKDSDIKFAKVNVDENQDLAMKYEISWIPNVMVFKNWKAVASLVWVRSLAEYKAVLNEVAWNSDLDWQQVKSNEINILWAENFDKQIKKEWKILVDFWAPWCWPCRMLAPVLESVAQKTWAKILKVNVDEPANQSLAYEYWISSIPHVFIFENWKQVDDFVGLRSEDEILQLLK